jgi:hypothetical protein
MIPEIRREGAPYRRAASPIFGNADTRIYLPKRSTAGMNVAAAVLMACFSTFAAASPHARLRGTDEGVRPYTICAQN